MKNILVCVDSFETGGVTNVVKYIYRNLDRSKYHMDFVLMRKMDDNFSNEILSRGDKIFYLEAKRISKLPLINYNLRIASVLLSVRGYIPKKHYDIAHIHAHGDIYTVLSRYLKIRDIIIHSHEAITEFNGDEDRSKLTSFILHKRRKLYRNNATYLVGDSINACIAKYGKAVLDDPKMRIVYPPIDQKRFNVEAYNEHEAEIKYKVDTDALNIIHVGRLSPVKNQKFLLDIIKEIKIKSKGKVHLYIVGEGEQKEMLENYAERIDVSDEVSFLAADTSPMIYKVMNCSILPSLSEAFGMVAVESQIMKVHCFASTMVPVDVDIGLCTFISLEQPAIVWADCIINHLRGSSVHNVDLKSNLFTVDKLLDVVEELYEGGNKE